MYDDIPLLNRNQIACPWPPNCNIKPYIRGGKKSNQVVTPASRENRYLKQWQFGAISFFGLQMLPKLEFEICFG